jgi:hypothetical protein
LKYRAYFGILNAKRWLVQKIYFYFQHDQGDETSEEWKIIASHKLDDQVNKQMKCLK